MDVRAVNSRRPLRLSARSIPLFLLFLVLACPSASAAQQEKSPQPGPGGPPIEIVADRLSADSVRDSVTFEGNVVATQADVTLYADRLHAEYSRGERAIEKISAAGNVRVVQDGKEGRAARAEFFNLEQRIVLTGDAELVQGKNSLKGDTVTIFLRENRSVITGGENGRVRAIIHPQGVLDSKDKDKEGR